MADTPNAFPLDKETGHVFVNIFEEYGPATWTVGGVTLAFPVVSISETGGNRISKDERPLRDGAHLQDTGSRAVEFSFACVFDNGLLAFDAEQQLDQINGGLDLYPDVLNGLLDSFSTHETGDLYVPTRGKVRARAESYSRDESAEILNHGKVRLVFCVDNEDGLDFSGFEPPSVSASAITVAAAVELEAETTGAWDGSVTDFTELANNIEGLANAPGDYLSDVETQAQIVKNAHDKVVKAHTDTATEGRDLLMDPESTTLYKHLSMLKEMAGQSSQSTRRGRPTYVTKTYTTRVSLPQVAAIELQDYDVLVEINPNLDDPLDIPAGTGVRVLSE